jgi:hypothetical protein
MNELTKADKKELRKLTEQMWQTDAAQTLKKLDDEFVKWRAGELSHGDLLDAIHQFHQHDARQLWWRYQDNKPDWIVKIGLMRGLIKLDALPERLRPLFQNVIDM